MPSLLAAWQAEFGRMSAFITSSMMLVVMIAFPIAGMQIVKRVLKAM